MNILKKILEKIKNIFVKKQEIIMIEEGKHNSDEEKNVFKESQKVKFEKIHKNKIMVETPICYGDGLGIKHKMEP